MNCELTAMAGGCAVVQISCMLCDEVERAVTWEWPIVLAAGGPWAAPAAWGPPRGRGAAANRAVPCSMLNLLLYAPCVLTYEYRNAISNMIDT